MPTLSDTRAVRDGQRTWRPTTRKNTKPGTPAHDDLVRRVFTADGPSRLWLTDITEHRTAEGKLYLCAVKDVYSRRIVGYSIGDRMKASLAVAALNNAVARRGDTAGCILHSDRGSQAGFNWSSQHPFSEVLCGSSTASGRSSDSTEVEIAWSPKVPADCRDGVRDCCTVCVSGLVRHGPHLEVVVREGSLR